MHDKVVAARDFIYARAKPLNGVNVENLLKNFSGVPTVVCILAEF